MKMNGVDFETYFNNYPDEKGYFGRYGGCYISDELRKAQKDPDSYKTLMVRVAGFSDYFVNLDPVIQNEIIERTEHDTM
jgi:hypothetical protein